MPYYPLSALARYPDVENVPALLKDILPTLLVVPDTEL
jgi:hypothetical protein